jgi:hypothetical protein
MTRPAKDADILILCAPAVLRHEPAPVTATAVHTAPGARSHGIALPNTVIIPADSAPGPGVPAAISAGPAGASLAPLFCLLSVGRQAWRPYTLMSYAGEDLLYIAMPVPPVRGDPAQHAHCRAWAAELSACHRSHIGQLNNHQCWFRNLHPGLEIEHKFTLPAGADIWHLAITTYQALRAGNLPGWIPEHGNNGGFEQWDFLNHVFEITEPAAERGYIAFIPGTDGHSGLEAGRCAWAGYM